MNKILQIDRVGSALPWITPRAKRTAQTPSFNYNPRNTLYLVPRHPASTLLRRRRRPAPLPTVLQRHPQLVDALFISVTLGAAVMLWWRGW